MEAYAGTYSSVQHGIHHMLESTPRIDDQHADVTITESQQ